MTSDDPVNERLLLFLVEIEIGRPVGMLMVFEYLGTDRLGTGCVLMKRRQSLTLNSAPRVFFREPAWWHPLD